MTPNVHTETFLTTLNLYLFFSTSDVVNSIYPEWDVQKNSMDLPTKGHFEPALPVIDGKRLQCAMHFYSLGSTYTEQLRTLNLTQLQFEPMTSGSSTKHSPTLLSKIPRNIRLQNDRIYSIILSFLGTYIGASHSHSEVSCVMINKVVSCVMINKAD